MSGGGKEVTVGYRYSLGMHLGICLGPVDAINEIRAGDRVAWLGFLAASGSTTIDNPSLFGGDEREGGLQGGLDVMMGEATQAANSYLTSKLGTPQPAYRGILSLVWKGGQISANNPYLKPWAIRVRRITKGWKNDTPWYPEKAPIGLIAAQENLVVADYASGIGSYTLLSGANLYSISSGPYGQQLDVASQNSGTVSQLGRTFPNCTPTRWRFKFKVTANNADDAPSYFLFGPAPTTANKIGFQPRRETAIDSLRRPVFYYGSGPTAVSMGSTGLTIDQWYQFTYTLTNASTGAFTAQISDAATGTVVSTFSSNLVGIGADSAQLRVTADTSGLTCPASFADMELHATIAGIGMNPAHIVYECLTNAEWGMGYATTVINDANFKAAADVFFAEGLGLCLHWQQQQPIEQFVQIVLDHAGAILAQEPQTGLFILTPLRGGTDPSTLATYDPSNVLRLEQYEKVAPSEMTNEVTVRFDDLATAQGGSVKAQNLAMITAQGGVVGATKNYPGLATPGLAMRIAMRDLLAASSPLARVRMIVTRAGYQLRPGGLIKFTWPKLGVSNMVLRILKVNLGSLDSGEIGVEGVEDVFSVPATTYAAQQAGGWTSPNNAPTAASNRLVREATYFEVQRELGAANAAALAADASFVAGAAVRPLADALDFALFARVGAAAYAEVGRGAFCPSGTLSAQLEQYSTTATIQSIVDGTLVDVGTFAQIGQEIVRVDAWNATTGAITLGRGLHGTTAKRHASGARIFFVDGFMAHDVTERVDAEVVNVRIAPRTGLGQLADGAAPTDTITLDQLPARPYAPGALRINGHLYPPSVTESVAATWAHRNRLQQNLEGDESGNIGPEASTTYNGWLRAQDGTILASTTGVTGTSWTPTAPTKTGIYRIEIQAERGGLVSGQMAVCEFTFTILTATASLITGGASGGSGQGGAAPGRDLSATASFTPGTATGGGPA